MWAQVCHIVQRAIERKIVGYKKGGSLAPYRLSDAFLKNAAENHDLLQAMFSLIPSQNIFFLTSSNYTLFLRFPSCFYFLESFCLKIHQFSLRTFRKFDNLRYFDLHKKCWNVWFQYFHQNSLAEKQDFLDFFEKRFLKSVIFGHFRALIIIIMFSLILSQSQPQNPLTEKNNLFQLR